MFAVEEIKSATLIEITDDKLYGEELIFSIPSMKGPRSLKISRGRIAYCESLLGQMIRRDQLVVGETYDLEIRK